MKQSVFRKKISVTGSKRTVEGVIVVTMNKAVHSKHPSLRAQHEIKACIGDVVWDYCDRLFSEADVLKGVEDMSNKFEKHMMEIAELEPEKTFTDKLTELGFNLAHEKHL